MSSSSPASTTPDEAIAMLRARIDTVGTEVIGLPDAAGRVLARPLLSDRDSPACDVSSMDGYALRAADLTDRLVPVSGESVPGRQPPQLLPARAVRIVTGAPLPEGADLVVPIEQIDESDATIRLKPTAHAMRAGQNVRRQGENLAAGSQFAAAGAMISPSLIAAMASFASTKINVYRRIRVGIINTGQELVRPDVQPSQWQIRDSNGPSLAALLTAHPWLDCETPLRVSDEPAQISNLIVDRLERCDAIILSGAVSVGPYDHVPEILRKLNCEFVFHRLPIRPGKPVLGAIGPQGQAVFGLPGNPVSALVTARRIVLPLLAHQAGLARPEFPALIQLDADDGATIPLWWYRLVRITGPGRVALVETHGSGDLVSLARSDGFIEVPPNRSSAGPWQFYAWHG